MKPLMKLLIGITFGILLGASVDAAVGTFTFKTTGASDTVEAVSLVYPQRVPEAGSVTTGSIADGSVTPAKISSRYNLLTDAEKTQALVGSSTVGLIAKSLTLPTTTPTYVSGTKTMLIPSTIDTGITEITEFGTVDYLSNGILSVNTATFGKGAVFTLSQNITAKLAGHASFTATKGTASSINIYVEGGKLYVQNNQGSTMTGVITFTGVVKP